MKSLSQKIVRVILEIQFGTTSAILAVLVLSFSLQGVAEEIEGAGNGQLGRSYTEIISEFAQKSLEEFENPLPAEVLHMSVIINDERLLKQELGDYAEFVDIDKAKNEVMDVLVRMDGRYPVITGEVGSGKSSVVDSIVDDIELNKLPGGAHQAELEGKVFFRVSARNFMEIPYRVMDPKDYIDTVAFIAQSLPEIDPIIVIEEAEFLTKDMLSILAEMAPSIRNGIPVIIEADNKSYSTTVKQYPPFERYEQKISIGITSKDKMFQILKGSGYLEHLKNRYSVLFDEGAIDAAVDVSEDYRLDLADPARTLQLLESVAIRISRENNGEASEANKKEIFSFVAEATGVPVVPQDREAFADYMKAVQERVLEKVKGQDHIINGLIRQFRRALTSRGKKKHSSAMIMGPTGVGKTYGAEVLAEEFYGSKERVLELDMTTYMDESKESILFGAANGLVSSQENKGILCEFLDGPGKGGGIIIMNELEEAHPSIVTRMMELFDNGSITCGDGKVRYLGRSLLVMTSNKASDRLLPASRVRGASEAELSDLIEHITTDQMKEAWTEKESYISDDSGVVKTAVVERMDEWYYARPLLQKQAELITDLEAEKFAQDLAKSDDINLQVDESFTYTLTSAFYNEENGARQLKRMVQKLIEESVYQYREKYGHSIQDFEISAKLHPSKKTESYITISEMGSENSVTISGPKIPVDNKLLDPEFRNRLRKLEKNLKSEVFGQDESIDSLVGAINARFLKANKKKVIAGYLIGTTGTGKTQLGKSTAKFLFNRPDAFTSLPMGNITNEHEMANVLSPPKGIVGSGDPGLLEQFLKKFPDGGVIILDEMSNAGGKDIALRQSIYQQLYDMLEEGKWTNPSGKEYDLSKYVFLFTGNDGEKIFHGANSDTIIEETYQELLNDQAQVDQILLDSGATPAFLQRLAFVTPMRPAKSDIRQMITRKMLEEWKYDVESAQPFDLEFSEDFIEEVAYLQFTPGGGARSVLKFFDKFLARIVGEVIHDFDWEEMLENGKRGKIKVGLSVDRFDHHFYDTDVPYRSKASLTLESSYEGEVLKSKQLDFTSSANFGAQAHEEDARDTAFHEMGHLVASFEPITGKHPVKVNIVPEKVGELSTLGYAYYRPAEVPGASDRNKLVHNVAGLLAGSMAESYFTSKPANTGRSNDLQKAGKMIQRALLFGHLDPSLDTAHAYIDDDGSVSGLPPSEQAKFQKLADSIMKDANELALKTIKENAHVIRAGVELLMEHGEINELTIQNLLAAGEKAKVSAGRIKTAAMNMGLSADKVLTVDLEGVHTTEVASEANTCENLLN